MNNILEKIFRYYKPNGAKLLEYGFTRSGDVYYYSTGIIDGQFTLNVKVTDFDVDAEVIDIATDEPYTLFLADGAIGSFVGTVRTAYENIMSDIADNCFDKFIFKSEYAQKIIEYVTEAYGDELEFLWEKFSDNAVWRRKDNKKWYGAMLKVSKSKLGLPSEQKIEIIDLRADAETINAIDGKTIFGGYHMNKKHWITVCLDGSVPLNEIIKMLDLSYDLAGKA